MTYRPHSCSKDMETCNWLQLNEKLIEIYFNDNETNLQTFERSTANPIIERRKSIFFPHSSLSGSPLFSIFFWFSIFSTFFRALLLFRSLSLHIFLMANCVLNFDIFCLHLEITTELFSLMLSSKSSLSSNRFEWTFCSDNKSFGVECRESYPLLHNNFHLTSIH